jgi:vacuolar-type H+-ATPase subunit F/Vma7/NTP pyrophosphatase (non-canonical NTP hydrolase)
MKIQQYCEATRRTWNDQGFIKNIDHAMLGIFSEFGEIASDIKQNVGYGKPIPTANLLGELGDAHYFVVRVMDQYAMDPELIQNLVDNSKLDRVPENPYMTWIFIASNETVALFRAISLHGKDNTELTSKNLYECIARFIALIRDIGEYFGYTLEQIRRANIAKLIVRIPDKFNADQILIRDLDQEINAIKNA